MNNKAAKFLSREVSDYCENINLERVGDGDKDRQEFVRAYLKNAAYQTIKKTYLETPKNKRAWFKNNVKQQLDEIFPSFG